MKLKIKPVSVDEADPFLHDALNREECAEILTQLISNIEDPSVISIDAPWGHGKTTFMNMLRQYLINNGFTTLHFNAWENDIVDDALATLIGEIGINLNELEIEKKKKTKAKKVFSSMKKVGTYLLKRSIPLAVHLGTAGTIDADEVYEKAISEFTEEIAEDLLENYEKSKANFNSFKESLSEFVEIIREDNNKPVVFFIDELDRCRPTFAIELLEKAKHLFSVPGFVFVIAIDKEQIGHSIRSVYGQDMDVDGYLRRFIDFDYSLPEPDNLEFAKYLFNKFEFTDYFTNRRAVDNEYAAQTIVEMFGDLSSIFHLSLRTQEQCFSNLTIALLTTPSMIEIHSHLLIFLLVLKLYCTPFVKPDLRWNYENIN